MNFDRRRIPTDASITVTPARDGWPLRTYFQPARNAPRGSILWLGGRGDIFEKYLEPFDTWTAAGYSVTSFDWRGQGGSGRLGADPGVGHVGDFSTWIDDLAAFYDDWSRRETGPHFVIGHSMGGHLLVRALAEHRIAPDAVVLSAPMLGFDTGPVPFVIAGGMARIMACVTDSRHAAWKGNERPASPRASRQAFLTHDKERYADEIWWKTQDDLLALGPPSWTWLDAAFRSIATLRRPGVIEKINLPVLILGTDGDQLVSPRAIHKFAARLPNARLLMLDKDVAHEILRERDGPRNTIMAAIADFLDSRA